MSSKDPYNQNKTSLDFYEKNLSSLLTNPNKVSFTSKD